MDADQTSSCFTQIRSIYSKLSEKEKLVANLILNEPKKIINSTINEIASDLGIADATVFRFCKKIGFKGYQALKITLASEIISPIYEIQARSSEEDQETDIIKKVFNSNIRTLQDTLSMIDIHNLTKATHALLAARKIDFYGNGGSGAVALDAHHKFLRTGMISNFYNDSHLQLLSAAQSTSEDVLVCISHSGANKDVMEVLKVAKNNGVTTIGITHYADTPLIQEADISLVTVSEETDFRAEALSSRLAQLSIIDALYVNVCYYLKDQINVSLNNLRRAIAVKRSH